MTAAQVAQRVAVDRARHRKACLLADVLEPRLAAGGWGPEVLVGSNPNGRLGDPEDPSLALVWRIAEHVADVSPASYTTRWAAVSELHRRARVAAQIETDVFGGIA